MNSDNIIVQNQPQSSEWWYGLRVLNAATLVTRVAVRSPANTKWTVCDRDANNGAYYCNPCKVAEECDSVVDPLMLPLSVRISSRTDSDVGVSTVNLLGTDLITSFG